MKAFNRLMAAMAAISVTVFVISMGVVMFTDGAHKEATQYCIYSLLASFVSLVLYHPPKPKAEG